MTLDRRLKRDTKERGMTHKEVMYQWEKHVQPAYAEFLKPHKSSADYIIKNNKDFNTCLDNVITKFKEVIAEQEGK